MAIEQPKRQQVALPDIQEMDVSGYGIQAAGQIAGFVTDTLPKAREEYKVSKATSDAEATGSETRDIIQALEAGEGDVYDELMQGEATKDSVELYNKLKAQGNSAAAYDIVLTQAKTAAKRRNPGQEDTIERVMSRDTNDDATLSILKLKDSLNATNTASKNKLRDKMASEYLAAGADATELLNGNYDKFFRDNTQTYQRHQEFTRLQREHQMAGPEGTNEFAKKFRTTGVPVYLEQGVRGFNLVVAELTEGKVTDLDGVHKLVMDGGLPVEKLANALSEVKTATINRAHKEFMNEKGYSQEQVDTMLAPIIEHWDGLTEHIGTAEFATWSSNYINVLNNRDLINMPSYRKLKEASPIMDMMNNSVAGQAILNENATAITELFSALMTDTTYSPNFGKNGSAKSNFDDILKQSGIDDPTDRDAVSVVAADTMVDYLNSESLNLEEPPEVMLNMFESWLNKYDESLMGTNPELLSESEIDSWFKVIRHPNFKKMLPNMPNDTYLRVKPKLEAIVEQEHTAILQHEMRTVIKDVFEFKPGTKWFGTDWFGTHVKVPHTTNLTARLNRFGTTGVEMRHPIEAKTRIPSAPQNMALGDFIGMEKVESKIRFVATDLKDIPKLRDAEDVSSLTSTQIKQVVELLNTRVAPRLNDYAEVLLGVQVAERYTIDVANDIIIRESLDQVKAFN